jgi:hypothetical protein
MYAEFDSLPPVLSLAELDRYPADGNMGPVHVKENFVGSING